MKPLLNALVLGLILAFALRAFRVVTLSGAWAGGAFVFAYLVLGGEVLFSGFALLVLFGTLASSIGRDAKRARGLAPMKREARHAGQAIANAGPGVLFLLAFEDFGRIAALAALASALADTAAGEIGMLRKGRPRLLLFGPKVAAGTNGGMTAFGLFSGQLAAGGHLLLAAGEPEGFVAVTAVFIGALVGQVTDSVLGATIESKLPKRFANEIVNALSNAGGGAIALFWMRGGIL